MTRRVPALALVAIGVGISPAAWATDHGHVVSITNSPIHLASNFVEITGEYALQRNLGIAGLAGYGNPKVTTTDGDGNEEVVTLTVTEVGAQARYYVLGSFDHGMQVGGELLYAHASGETDDVEATASGLSIAPFIGYKKAARWGLTFDAQLGVSFTAMRAKAKADTGEEGEAEDDDVGVLLNLNLGWSF